MGDLIELLEDDDDDESNENPENNNKETPKEDFDKPKIKEEPKSPTRKPVGFMQSCFLCWFPCGFLDTTWCQHGHYMMSMWKPYGVNI